MYLLDAVDPHLFYHGPYMRDDKKSKIIERIRYGIKVTLAGVLQGCTLRASSKLTVRTHENKQ